MAVRRRDLDQVQRELVARRGELATRRQRVERDLERRNDPLVADSSDQAIQNDGPLQAIGAAASHEIAAIDTALERLKLGLYGICFQCGEEIEAARLRAVPHAVTCAQCAGH